MKFFGFILVVFILVCGYFYLQGADFGDLLALAGMVGEVAGMVGEEEFVLISEEADLFNLPFGVQDKVRRHLRGGGFYPVGLAGENIVYPQKKTLWKEDDWNHLVLLYKEMLERKGSDSSEVTADSIVTAASRDKNLSRDGNVLYPIEVDVFRHNGAVKHIEVVSLVPREHLYLINHLIGTEEGTVRHLLSQLQGWGIAGRVETSSDLIREINLRIGSENPTSQHLHLPVEIEIRPFEGEWKVGRVFGDPRMQFIHSIEEFERAVKNLHDGGFTELTARVIFDTLRKKESDSFFTVEGEPLFPWGLRVTQSTEGDGENYVFFTAEWLGKNTGSPLQKQVINGKKGWVIEGMLEVRALHAQPEVFELFGEFEDLLSEGFSSENLPLFCWIEGGQLKTREHHPRDLNGWIRSFYLKEDNEITPCFFLKVEYETDLPTLSKGLKNQVGIVFNPPKVRDEMKKKGLSYPFFVLVDTKDPERFQIEFESPRIGWGVLSFAVLRSAGDMQGIPNMLGLEEGPETDRFWAYAHRSIAGTTFSKDGLLFFRLDPALHDREFAAFDLAQ